MSCCENDLQLMIHCLATQKNRGGLKVYYFETVTTVLFCNCMILNLEYFFSFHYYLMKHALTIDCKVVNLL